jgi:hypothetical protein
MFIEPIRCNNCHRAGRPGELGFSTSQQGNSLSIHCNCGNTITVDAPRDQCILSPNMFTRLAAASNYCEVGMVKLKPGTSVTVKFQRPFDFPSKAHLTPISSSQQPFLVKEYSLHHDSMIVLSSYAGNSDPNQDDLAVSWIVHGLVDIDALPAWYTQFFSAIRHLESELYKPALLDYAASFEMFISELLNKQLTGRYDMQVAQYLLKRQEGIEKRCTELLEFTIDHRLTERNDVYQPWQQRVQQPRNALSHGARLSVNREEAEAAHQAVYQAIRYVQSLVGQSMDDILGSEIYVPGILG